MAQEQTKVSLKESDPIKYYKKKKKWLSVAKVACNLLPPLVVLIVYAIMAWTGGSFTNPLVPWKFGVGVVLVVCATVFIVISELKAATKANKESGEGAVFTSSIIWLFIATILWLFYLTMFYLIIFCFAEFIGCFLGAFCTSGIKKCNELIKKNQDAELEANAYVRVQNKNKEKNTKTNVGSSAIE